MGSVWRARHNDGRFDGEAAVKLLRSRLFDAAMQERFRREGATLARLHHAQVPESAILRRGREMLKRCSQVARKSAEP